MSKSVIERINRNILEHKQTVNKQLDRCKYTMEVTHEIPFNTLDRPKKLERFRTRDKARIVKYNRSNRIINDDIENTKYENDDIKINKSFDKRRLKICIPVEERELPDIVPVEHVNVIDEVLHEVPHEVLHELPNGDTSINKKRKVNKRKHNRLMRELLQVSTECERIVIDAKIQLNELLKLATETAKQNREIELSKNRGFFGYIMSYFY
jgi:hypothetical protein